MTEAVLEAGTWIYKMLFLLIIASIAVATVGLIVENDINTARLQGELMVQRILYDPAGPWYRTEQGVVQPGVLDRTRFTQELMDAAFVYPQNYGGAKVTLVTAAERVELYVNQPTYEFLATTAATGARGSGEVYVTTYQIAVVNGPAREPGVLVIERAEPARA